MAIQQEGSLQQPIPYQPPATGETSPTDATTGVAGQGAESEFSRTLERQISQAIQPALDDFRQQMAQTLQREIAQAPGGAATAATIAQPAKLAQAPDAPSAPSAPSGRGLLGQVTQQAQTALSDTLQPAVKETIRPALEKAERQGEEWATSLLVAALTALLTESTRQFIEQRADSGLRALTQKLFEAAPEGVASHDMPLRVETALQGVLHGALDALFAEEMRTALRQDGQAAIQQSFRGDLGAAVGEAQDIVQRIADALVSVLRREWPALLRLALALALLALDSSLMQSEHSDPKVRTADKREVKQPEQSKDTKDTRSSKGSKDSKATQDSKDETKDRAASRSRSAGRAKSGGAAREAAPARSGGRGKTSASARSTSRTKSASQSKDTKDS